MIRATWRKGWVSSDEKGLTFKVLHNIRNFVQVYVLMVLIFGMFTNE